MATALLGLDVGGAAWLPRAVGLSSGTAKRWTTVPARAANAMLPEVARLVADLPLRTTPEVLWTAGASELLVRTDQTRITCNLGIVGVDVAVACDQVRGEATVSVPFATGTERETRGLYLSTFEKPSGPPAVVDVWSDALIAFAWECLLTLAAHVSAAAGKDGSGRPLVPGAIASARGAFLVLPMVRTR